ncbi:MAG: DUF1905 domain-containing protein [Ignavibacteriae bacterium]|nr:DUF1905 domain-containing protein [Ignavibacteriota bacterium]
MKKYKFSAEIMAKGNGAFVYFPYDVKKEFGTKGQVKVKVKFNGFEYRGSLTPMGMEFHLFGIRKEIRDTIKKEIGDFIEVTVEQDLEPRIVEVPKDFQVALNKNNLAKEIFEKFAYTHWKEYVRWIEEAKKEETRNKRITKAIEMISAGKKFS